MWADGRRYIGNWDKGIQHGLSVYITGMIIEGLLKNVGSAKGSRKVGEWILGRRKRYNCQ